MSGEQTASAIAEASTSKESMSLEEKIGMAKSFDREMKASTVQFIYGNVV